MKATVQYYDIESDSGATHDCLMFNYVTEQDEFHFTPWGEKRRIYKSVGVKNPSIIINYNKYGLDIRVNGWMAVKSGGYWKNEVIIRIKNED